MKMEDTDEYKMLKESRDTAKKEYEAKVTVESYNELLFTKAMFTGFTSGWTFCSMYNKA